MIRTRLAIAACLRYSSSFRQHDAPRLVVLHHDTPDRVHGRKVKRAAPDVGMYCLQAFALPPTDLHNLLLQPLLALIARPLGH